MKILLATNNTHKAREIFDILDNSKIEIVLQNDILGMPYEVDENGSTLEENAYLKAIELYTITQIPTIADDTGLEIEALHGAPGVYSARYAGVHGNDKANRSKVLDTMKDISKRNARFRTVICFHDGIRTLFSEGICQGQILIEERGNGGFGYDSIFMPDGASMSFAEMSPHEKNSISHRRNALHNLRMAFERYDE